MSNGFTLIEMLAVIAIIAMVAALGSVSLVTGDTQAQLRSAVWGWQNLDADARLHACTTGQAEMSLSEHLSQVHLESGIGITNVIALPSGNFGELTAWDADGSTRNTQTIRFDSLGRCVDYQVRILSDGAHIAGWKVAGLTGWIVENGDSS